MLSVSSFFFDRSGECAYDFLLKSDDWGRLFSILPLSATIFPNLSDYNYIRNKSLKLRNMIKVTYN